MLHKDKRDKMAEAVKSSYGSHNSHEEETPEEGVIEIEVMEMGSPTGDLTSELQSLADSWDPQTDEGMQYKRDVEELLGKETDEE